MICVPELTFSRLATQAYADGYAVHGEIDLQLETFANRLLLVVEKHLGPNVSAISLNSFFISLHLTDLYLASACSQPSDAAWRRFEAAYRKFINDVARFVSSSADEAREVAADVEANLYMPGLSGQSRIASFDGQQSLATWLRVVISRIAINHKASRWNKVERLDPLEDVPDNRSAARIEANIRRGRYEAIVEDCFREACKSLTDRERLIVLLHYGEGLRLVEIARCFDLHPSRVTRGLQSAQSKIQKAVVSLMTLKYELGPVAIQEALAEMLENAAYSPLMIIKELKNEETASAVAKP